MGRVYTHPFVMPKSTGALCVGKQHLNDTRPFLTLTLLKRCPVLARSGVSYSCFHNLTVLFDASFRVQLLSLSKH